MDICAVILAAGLGTRMKSKYPKVLFNIAGEPIISHVIRAVRAVNPTKIVVIVGHSKELVIEAVKKTHGDFPNLTFVTQAEQKGTGHALIHAREELSNQGGMTFVLCGDTPLLTGDIFRNLLKFHEDSSSDATVLTTRVKDPKGYGRIVRDAAGHVTSIVEERDAAPEIRKIDEINTGVYLFATPKLIISLSKLKPNNDQHEYYLTDTISILNSENSKVMAYPEPCDHLMMGINNRYELATAARFMRERINRMHMINGVTMTDPTSTYIDVGVEIENDVTIHQNTSIIGKTKISADSVIGPDSSVSNSTVGKNCVITYSVVEDSTISDNVKVGPYSHLRPGAKLSENVHVGNYVEVKNSVIGVSSKANHLSYIGDAVIGENCNIGAGTITCNYDGVNKNKTVIGDGVFIGSNAALVAPVKLGDNSLVAAGSVITKDVPPYALAIERSPQVVKEDYMKKRNIKKKKQ
ncbi:MAG TPA: bifunctional UDP-N-acetylglucosamine diphosphorylase/glucosamine-1-phosphate N-acetyltransferase GlmU [Candidatus Wallbacteria bacterium]|nr:bifunctional UDP-N-acetylglucosamine diphosphorylase/glucosamine-1-phosphate N-acetyltransferase GlmU [Candidatus Wallbacteria bacterium]